MLQLLVMRHAKSDWDASFDSDHERPLAERGVEAARRMGRLMTELGVVPDRAMTSTAVRARTTVELAVEAGAWGCPIEPTPAFYTEDAAGVLDEIAATPAAGRLMVVGHDPTWPELVSLLIGGGRVKLATASVACIELVADRWNEVAPGAGRLKWLVSPKVIAAAADADHS